jgi:ribosome-binding protein aMBF1 (putative translation factor)
MIKNMTLVKRPSLGSTVWHIMDRGNPTPDSNTHTLCGDHWFYEITTAIQAAELSIHPICPACADIYNNPGHATAFPDRMAVELQTARAKHPSINTHHEAYSIILEEIDEYWEEVRRKKEARSQAYMLSELVQIAAMCQRAAEDLGLVKEVKDGQ